MLMRSYGQVRAGRWESTQRERRKKRKRRREETGLLVVSEGGKTPLERYALMKDPRRGE